MKDDVSKATEALERVRARLQAMQDRRTEYQEDHDIVPKNYDLSDPARTPEDIDFAVTFIAHEQCIRDLTDAVELLLARGEGSVTER